MAGWVHPVLLLQPGSDSLGNSGHACPASWNGQVGRTDASGDAGVYFGEVTTWPVGVLATSPDVGSPVFPQLDVIVVRMFANRRVKIVHCSVPALLRSPVPPGGAAIQAFVAICMSAETCPVLVFLGRLLVWGLGFPARDCTSAPCLLQSYRLIVCGS